jgi:hypothetical protein
MTDHAGPYRAGKAGGLPRWRSAVPSILFRTIDGAGPSNHVTLRGDRATALIEDIWCENIRGCSYSGAFYSMSAMR